MPIYGTPPKGATSLIVNNSVIPVSGFMPTSANNFGVANVANGVWFRVPYAIPVDRADVSIGTAVGNLDFGIFSTADFATLTRLASSGSIVIAGTGTQTYTFTQLNLNPGVDYFAMIALSDATATIISVGTSGSNGTVTKMALSKTSSFPLPASLSSLSGANRIPIIRIYKG